MTLNVEGEKSKVVENFSNLIILVQFMVCVHFSQKGITNELDSYIDKDLCEGIDSQMENLILP